MDFENLLKNMFAGFDLNSLKNDLNPISNSLKDTLEKAQTHEIDFDFIKKSNLDRILNLVGTLSDTQREAFISVYDMESILEKLVTVNDYNNADDEDLDLAYCRFLEGLTATESERKLLLDTLRSEPHELHDIWYNYYFSDIIESEKADKEMMDNMSHDDKMAALEMFQNNEAFQTEFSNAMLKAGESCRKMFEGIASHKDEIAENIKNQGDKIFKNEKNDENVEK